MRIVVPVSTSKTLERWVAIVVLLGVGAPMLFFVPDAPLRTLGLVIVATAGWVAIGLRRPGAPQFMLDDEGIHDLRGRRPLVIRWSEIESVCPTPFQSPAERSEHFRRLLRELAVHVRTLSLQLRMRDPSSFWTRRGQRDQGSSIDLERIPSHLLPGTVDDFYAWLRTTARFELVALWGPFD